MRSQKRSIGRKSGPDAPARNALATALLRSRSPSRSTRPRLAIASALMPKVRRGTPHLLASSSRVAGPPFSASKSPTALATKRCFAAMKPRAIRMIGSGVTSAICASRLLNPLFYFSASLNAIGDHIRIDNAGNESGCRSVRRCGVNHMRTNLVEEDPAKLWSQYLLLVAVEEAFKNLKGDLAIRPIFHQLEARIEAHIFIAFLAYCLHVTLARRLHALAPGLTPRSVLEKFAAAQMIDVHLTNHRWPRAGA